MIKKLDYINCIKPILLRYKLKISDNELNLNKNLMSTCKDIDNLESYQDYDYALLVIANKIDEIIDKINALNKTGEK